MRIRDLAPGILLCGVIALAATFLAEHHGGPQLLYALLLGLALHFLHDQDRIQAGLEFCSRTVLRIGVALLGARITWDQVTALGLPVALLVLLSVLATIFLGVVLARALGLRCEEGLLSGGSVAICGASAALAISAVLPRNKANEHFTLLAVVSVTVLSTLAMIVYPVLIQALRLGDATAGIFLGGTIHDVAQVVAAGLIISPQTADTATLVKLFRVMLLLPVVVLIGLVYRHERTPAEPTARPPLLPGFLLAFVALMALASTGLMPQSVAQVSSELSRACLVMAIAAVGIKTSLGDLSALGWKAMSLFVAETIAIAAFVVMGLLALRYAGLTG